MLVLLCVVLLGGATPARAEESIPAPETATETILIRNGDAVIYEGTADLLAAGSVSVTDSEGSAHSVDARSVLGILAALDARSDAFSLSSITYYPSFNSLYLKCVALASGETLCDNWQFVLNSAIPSSGMDSTLLAGGETIGLYFGSPYRLVFDASQIRAGVASTVAAQAYGYLDNAWHPRTGVSIGAARPNPDDPWNPVVVLSVPVDAAGSAALVIPEAGEYAIGVVEDYLFPSYPLTVVEPEAAPASGSLTGSPSVSPDAPAFSVPNAIAYVLRQQKTDGSVGGDDLHTDWAAIALASAGISDEARATFLQYFRTHAPGPLLTDIERRTMALLALGENPYAFSGLDHVAAIVAAFDGVQFGEAERVHDDIFALIPLSAAGYSADDEPVMAAARFIVSKQHTNGSWEESVDLTAAAIQALRAFGVEDEAIVRASQYLAGAQSSDGGFGNVYSTAWAAQAMHAAGGSWTHGGATPLDRFAREQRPDGAMLSESDTEQNRIWATSYVIPAALGKPWSAILRKVERPAETAGPAVVFDSAAPEPMPAAEPKHVGIAATAAHTARSSTVLVENGNTAFPSEEKNAEPAPVPPAALAAGSTTTLPAALPVAASALFLGLLVWKHAIRRT